MDSSIATPKYNGYFNDAIVINGPYYPNKIGYVNIYTKVIMSDALEVSGAITTGGLSALTTGTGYTKTQVDQSLLLKQDTLNWLSGESNGDTKH